MCLVTSETKVNKKYIFNGKYKLLEHSLQTARKGGSFAEDWSCFACYGVSFISHSFATQLLKANCIVKTHYL